MSTFQTRLARISKGPTSSGQGGPRADIEVTTHYFLIYTIKNVLNDTSNEIVSRFMTNIVDNGRAMLLV